MGIWEAVFIGLVAGVAGTVVLTLAERLDMAITSRPSSAVPGQVGVRLIGGDPHEDQAAVQRLNPVVHWSHGIALGVVSGLLTFAGLGFVAATVAFCAIVWVGDVVLYKGLGIAELPWRWTRAELLRDLYGKGAFALATSAAFALLAALT